MSDAPKLDREEYLRQMRAEFERTLEQVADAVDAAPAGRIIRDSEYPARDALEEFRRKAYEKAIQLKSDAAEAAFPPSEQPGDKSEEA
ncbi:hypothetical protein [Lignipirellula cremea]|uniref:Uncharacterized protein n=1 Tax=Lignipirellula cremea TaxID=2528010 RepID=A0A518DRP3_9BACT|nr:hypothetical protein [Lignipirellula cremea]QDU92429.1 hypothetical protein Pla8534_01770 [Lignipirellula cremea]QDU94499.1 hypothetical protein Pla8534_22900 [Lignipirellula cremea]